MSSKIYKGGLHRRRFKNRQLGSLFLDPTDLPEVLSIISKLKSKSSYGQDGISTNLLKSISQSIAQPLTILINKSIDEGKVPEALKIAKVIPIHKGSEKQFFNNYRPVSVLNSISKVFEKVIFKRLYSLYSISRYFMKDSMVLDRIILL